MPFRKKILYYGLLLLLTLLALDGMARLAYYAAYGHWYGGGPAATLTAANLPADTNADSQPWRIRHPFYGFTNRAPQAEGNALNAMPPQQRPPDTVVVGLLGGSLAEELHPFLQDALNRHFADHNLPRQPRVVRLAVGGAKQPQQTMILTHTLLLGGEFDLLVNLDGFNEIIFSAGWNPRDAVFPFFPTEWDKQVSLTSAEFLLAGRIGALRREQARLTAAGETPILRGSAVFGLINRYQREKNAAEIIRLNHQLAATATPDQPAAPAATAPPADPPATPYTLEKHGPRGWPTTEKSLWPAAAAAWYRGAVTLNRLAQLAGADYYHFLQPNQYVPDSKPLSPEELTSAYDADSQTRAFIEQGYPLLTAFNQDLQNQGLNYFDLTEIFADHPETLYRDVCCHLNYRGNELLAAAMTQRMAPALRRWGAENPPRSLSPLNAARRPE